MSIRHILVVLRNDLQRTPALERAIELARRTGAQLHLRMHAHHPGIAAVGMVRPDVMRLARNAYVTQRERWLEEGAAELREQGIGANVRCTWEGSLEENVVAEVLEVQPDLVIMDAAMDSTGRHLHLTSQEKRVARLCPAPLLLVQPASLGGARRVFAAIDPGAAGSDHEALAVSTMQAAATLAACWSGGAVRAVHVFPGAAALGWAEDSPPDGRVVESLEMLRREHVRRCNEVAEAQGIPESARHFVEGAAAPTLAALASNPCHDVIAIGNIHRSGFSRFMFGSTTEALLAKANCDVLVVKPAGFRDALLAQRRSAIAA